MNNTLTFAIIERDGSIPAHLYCPDALFPVADVASLREQVRREIRRAVAQGLRYVRCEGGYSPELGEYISYEWARGSLHRWFCLPLAAL